MTPPPITPDKSDREAADVQEHEVIYLAPRCLESSYDDRHWCQDDAPEDCDCPDGPHPWVKYVLAATAATPNPLTAQLVEALREALRPYGIWDVACCNVVDKTLDAFMEWREHVDNLLAHTGE